MAEVGSLQRLVARKRGLMEGVEGLEWWNVSDGEESPGTEELSKVFVYAKTEGKSAVGGGIGSPKPKPAQTRVIQPDPRTELPAARL